MRKRWKKLLLILIVLGAALFLYFQHTDGVGPPYAPFTTAEMGTSLLYETLERMGYPVHTVRTPLTRYADLRYVYVIIQPFNPAVTQEMAEDMLDWVRRGGRLIFLHSRYPTVVDGLLPGNQGRQMNGFVYYEEGRGSVLTGNAIAVTNETLAFGNAAGGHVLHQVLSTWDAERIVFSIYYQGFHAPQTFFSQLPLVLRLVIIQLGIAVLVLLWHFGKRFGKPIPVYTEIEREENEQVRALARLYYAINRRSKHNVQDADR